MQNNMEENKEEEKKVVTEQDFDSKIYITDEGYFIERGLVPPKLRSPLGCIGDTEKQQKAWDHYIKTWREGKPNATEAGLVAGYTPKTAQNLSQFKWFKEKKDKLRRSKMMSNAERNLSRILNLDYKKMKLMPDGSTQEGIDNDTLRIVADVSKTIVTTLGKDLGYSTKTEVSGGMNSEINIKSISYADPIEIEAQVVDEVKEQITQGETKVVEEIVKQNEENQN